MYHRVTSQLVLMLVLSLAATTIVSSVWACGGGGGSGCFTGHYGQNGYYQNGGHLVVVGGDDYGQPGSYACGYDGSCNISMEQSCGWQSGCGLLPNGAGAYYYPATAGSACGY
jgi:hypothetical protein